MAGGLELPFQHFEIVKRRHPVYPGKFTVQRVVDVDAVLQESADPLGALRRGIDNHRQNIPRVNSAITKP